MRPLYTFNGWMMDKILRLLSKDDIVTETSHYTADGYRAVVMDQRGYRYEIYIKTLNNDDNEVSNAHIDSKTGYVAFPKAIPLAFK